MNQQVSRSTAIKIVLVFIMIGVILKGAAIFAFSLHWDSNYYLNIADNYLRRGELTPYMWRLGADSNIIAGSGTGYGIFIQLIWFQIFGLSALSGHILNYLLGVAMLTVLFFMMREWWQDTIAALVGVAFTGLMGLFIATFYIRMDAAALLMYTILLYVHVLAVRRQKLAWHALLGVLVIVAAEIHILSIIYIGAFSIYYLMLQIKHWRSGEPFLTLTPSVAFFVSAFVAGVLYLMIHVVPDPAAYFVIARDCPACAPASPLKEIARFAIVTFEAPIEMTIILMAFGIIIVRRSDADKHLLWVVGSYLVVQSVISPPPQDEYAVHILPLLALAVGGVFANGSADGAGISRVQAGTLVGAGIVLTLFNLLVISVQLAVTDPVPDEMAYVQTYIPTDTVVMASPPDFEYLIRYPSFMSYESGEQYGITLRGEDYQTYYNRERPRVMATEPIDDDRVIWAYMNQYDFVQVRDSVWVEETLLMELTGDQSAPEITITTSANDVAFGDCVIVSWDVTGADEVYWSGDVVPAQNEIEICPVTTGQYTLQAHWIGGIEREQIELIVN